MKKAHSQKISAPSCIEKLRCNIKTMRAGRPNDMQTLFDAFEVKLFNNAGGCKVERKKRVLEDYFQK